MTDAAPAPRRRLSAGGLLLILAGVFLLVCVLAAVVLREQIFQTALDPGVPYQTYDIPPPPDYAEQESWARYDSITNDATSAVFFIHPTTYDGGSDWNAPWDRPQERAELLEIVLPNYVEPFAAAGPVRAPHYRQAALYAFMNNREDSQLARMTAYRDVRAAFEAFLADLGEDRAFILAGVGQGGMHATGLLLEIVAADEDLSRRLAAAYVLDAPLPLDLVEGPLASLGPCRGETDVRCLISYIPARPAERSRIDAILERSMTWDAGGGLNFVSGRGLLCVNPLLWTTAEDYAPARLHGGGAAAEGLAPGESPSPLANQTSAQCQNGLLMIEQPRSSALRRPSRLGEDRRVPPFNLFYVDLRADAQRRMETLEAILAEEARYAPPLDAPESIEEADVIPVDPPGGD